MRGATITCGAGVQVVTVPYEVQPSALHLYKVALPLLQVGGAKCQEISPRACEGGNVAQAKRGKNEGGGLPGKPLNGCPRAKADQFSSSHPSKPPSRSPAHGPTTEGWVCPTPSRNLGGKFNLNRGQPLSSKECCQTPTKEAVTGVETKEFPRWHLFIRATVTARIHFEGGEGFLPLKVRG
ncbi:hypothetical protein RRG08_000237 [Elysia crispata]|uniref:Uncharacterized protein n=1 Tax=Elysia crispata TaxID=231223 RepID=A0AAE1AX92_9GAST|nr:hypothetical protein RRG08_000237 [Elysia crispata]